MKEVRSVSGSIRASWLEPGRHTPSEVALLAVLDNLVRHDMAADIRAKSPNCVELQHAIKLLNDVSGSILYEPRTETEYAAKKESAEKSRIASPVLVDVMRQKRWIP
jgi:hypothetical protein